MEDAIRSNPQIEMQRRWNENGMDELILGLFCSVIGSAYMTHLFWSMPWLPIMLCGLGMTYARKALLGKLIFPRTGYVVFRPPKTRMRVLWTFAGVTMVLAAALAVWARSLPDLMWPAGPALGLVFASIFVWSAIQYRLTYYYVFAAISVAMGVFTYMWPAGPMWVMLGIGMPMALSGAWHMRRFLKTHPVIEDQHD